MIVAGLPLSDDFANRAALRRTCGEAACTTGVARATFGAVSAAKLTSIRGWPVTFFTLSVTRSSGSDQENGWRMSCPAKTCRCRSTGSTAPRKLAPWPVSGHQPQRPPTPAGNRYAACPSLSK